MRRFLLSASLACMLALTNCTLPQMAVSPEFQQNAEELPVAGRKILRPNGSFQIGNYTVDNVHRGWKNLGGFSADIYKNIDARQRYGFSVQNGQGSEWYVYGASRLQDKSLQLKDAGITIDVGPNMKYYASHFTSPESGQWHLLTVDPGNYMRRKKFRGELANRRTTYTIVPVYKFEGTKLSMSDVVGYEFKDSENVVGAVQVVNNGKVWVSQQLSPDARMVLASGMASLLLYEKLYEAVENMESN